MDRLGIIEKSDLLATLPSAARELLAGEARARIVATGEVLCTEGEHGRAFWLVGSGLLAVQQGQPPREVARLMAGACFGEMSLLTGEPRVATVTALIRSELLEFDRPAFLRLFSQHPALASAMSSLVAMRRAGLARAIADAPQPVAALDQDDEVGILDRMKRLFGLR